jgi:hypothetical protein
MGADDHCTNTREVQSLASLAIQRVEMAKATAEIDDAHMFTHGFGRILLGQSACTVVGIVLQPCDAMDRPDMRTPGSPLAQEME